MAEYRSLRWNLGDIAGGTSKSVKARMKVKTRNRSNTHGVDQFETKFVRQ